MRFKLPPLLAAVVQLQDPTMRTTPTHSLSVQPWPQVGSEWPCANHVADNDKWEGRLDVVIVVDADVSPPPQSPPRHSSSHAIMSLRAAASSALRGATRSSRSVVASSSSARAISTSAPRASDSIFVHRDTDYNNPSIVSTSIAQIVTPRLGVSLTLHILLSAHVALQIQ